MIRLGSGGPWEQVYEVFGTVRPAATLAVVAGLLHPDHLVEVEAYLGPDIAAKAPARPVGARGEVGT